MNWHITNPYRKDDWTVDANDFLAAVRWEADMHEEIAAKAANMAGVQPEVLGAMRLEAAEWRKLQAQAQAGSRFHKGLAWS